MIVNVYVDADVIRQSTHWIRKETEHQKVMILQIFIQIHVIVRKSLYDLAHHDLNWSIVPLLLLLS